VLVNDETGAANKVVARSQNTMDQAKNESTAPDKLSMNLIGDQLKKFRTLRPTNPPMALPIPMPINNVEALSAVRVTEVFVAAPFTASIRDLPSQAPKTNPTSENALINNPRFQPDTSIKTAKPVKIMSR
jgi:hypothetical protein